MKKTISLLLVLVLCLSLCACGGGNDTPEATEVPTETTIPESTMLSKEELEAIAIPYTMDDLSNAINNKALAGTFVGNTYSFEGRVHEVREDCVILEFNIPDDSGNYFMPGVNYICAIAYLPLEELIELEYTQRVQVVGMVSEVIETSTSLGSETYNVPAVVFENVYINQYYEITAPLKGENHSADGDGYNFKLGDSDYYRIVYFAEGVDLSGIDTDGGKITFLTKQKYQYGLYVDGVCYYDAILKE